MVLIKNNLYQGDNFITNLSKSKMGLNLSRGKPLNTILVISAIDG